MILNTELHPSAANHEVCQTVVQTSYVNEAGYTKKQYVKFKHTCLTFDLSIISPNNLSGIIGRFTALIAFIIKSTSLQNRNNAAITEKYIDNIDNVHQINPTRDENLMSRITFLRWMDKQRKKADHAIPITD